MREKVILICNNCLSRNYNTFKNSLGKKERLELKKFCSACNRHILHKETR